MTRNSCDNLQNCINGGTRQEKIQSHIRYAIMVYNVNSSNANNHCRHCWILTRAGSCSTLLAFCGWPRARQSAIGRRGIGAGTGSCLGSSATRHCTGTPSAPVRPTTVHWNWKVMDKKLELMFKVQDRLYLQNGKQDGDSSSKAADQQNIIHKYKSKDVCNLRHMCF